MKEGAQGASFRCGVLLVCFFWLCRWGHYFLLHSSWKKTPLVWDTSGLYLSDKNEQGYAVLHGKIQEQINFWRKLTYVLVRGDAIFILTLQTSYMAVQRPGRVHSTNSRGDRLGRVQCYRLYIIATFGREAITNTQNSPTGSNNLFLYTYKLDNDTNLSDPFVVPSICEWQSERLKTRFTMMKNLQLTYIYTWTL